MRQTYDRDRPIMRHMAFAKREKPTIVTAMEGASEIPVRVKATSRLIWLVKAAFWAAAAACSLVLAGFVAFSSLVSGNVGDDIRAGDAIVVLTGGDARIPEGVKLLAQGKGHRLLISGVNPVTTRSELAELAPNSKRWFRCCIDLGQEARDTIGNAAETKAWVKQRGFKSLVVVTSTYHMPRSLAELRRALPDVAFIPYPVRPRNLHLDEWWSHQGSLQLLAMEYMKFVPALGRCVLAEYGRGRGIFGGTQQCLNAAGTL
jgi:uncharacterized SAM-binding protein YcdF (DUF218 family)